MIFFEFLLSRPSSLKNNGDLAGLGVSIPLERLIWRGEMLENQRSVVQRRTEYFTQYITHTIRKILRDAVLSGHPLYAAQWAEFLRALARAVGHELNCKLLAEKSGVSPEQVMRWLSVLEQSGIWLRIRPFGDYLDQEQGAEQTGTLEQSDRSKGFFSDTGLLCFLLEVDESDQVRDNRTWGFLLENWVVLQLEKAKEHIGFMYTYWRLHDGTHEVDFVITYNNTHYPIEVKSSDDIGMSDCSGMQAFYQAYPEEKTAPGVVIYGGSLCQEIGEKTQAEDQRAYGRDRVKTSSDGKLALPHQQEKKFLAVPWFYLRA